MKSIWTAIKISLLIVVILAIAGFLLLQSESVSEFVFKRWVQQKYSNVKIKDISISKQFFRKKDRVIFRDVRIDSEIENERYIFRFEQIIITDVLYFLQTKKILHVLLKNFEIESKKVNASRINIELFSHFEDSFFDYVTGNAQMDSISLFDYEFQRVDALFESEDQLLDIFDVTMKFYEGKLEGGIGIEFTEIPEYSVDLTIFGVRLDQLREANPAAFSKFNGTINGKLDFSFADDSITEANVSLIGVGGMSLRATLVKQLFGFLEKAVPYIPKFDDFPDSQALIRNDEFVPFEMINLELKKEEEKKLFGELKMISAKYNLDLDLTSDINVEAGVQSLVGYILNQ